MIGYHNGPPEEIDLERVKDLFASIDEARA
jgi:hypothetical protein